MCCSRWLKSGGLNMSPCPFVSQLAFVWDISAWLTPELSVRGGCLCLDFVTRLEDGGDKGEEFWWHHLLLRQFISTLPSSFRLFHHTHAHTQRHEQMDKNIWCWLSLALKLLRNPTSPLPTEIQQADSYPDKYCDYLRQTKTSWHNMTFWMTYISTRPNYDCFLNLWWFVAMYN